MRVASVRSLCRSGLLLWAGLVVIVAPGTPVQAGLAALPPAVAYGGLTLLTFLSWPAVRRADLAALLLALVGGLESVRAVLVWHGSASVLLQSVGAIAAIYATSFAEGFRSAARQASTTRFQLRGQRRRWRDAGGSRSARPFDGWSASTPTV